MDVVKASQLSMVTAQDLVIAPRSEERDASFLKSDILGSDALGRKYGLVIV